MSDENNWSTLAIVSFSMLCQVVSIPHIWSRYVQRQIFLRKHNEKGHFSKKEDFFIACMVLFPLYRRSNEFCFEKHKLQQQVWAALFSVVIYMACYTVWFNFNDF